MATETITSDHATSLGAFGDGAVSSLDAIFNPPPARGDGATEPDEGSQDADETTGTDEEEDEEGEEGQDENQDEVDENGEPVKPVKAKKEKPDSAMVEIEHRGQKFQIPAAQAGLFKALQTDHLEATRKITEQAEELKAVRTAASKPQADPEKAAQARTKAIEQYDKALWKAIDDEDGKGLTDQIIAINRAQYGPLVDTIQESLASLQEGFDAKIKALETAVYQGMGDTLARNNIGRALATDLADMGHAADAVSVEQVQAEFNALWPNRKNPDGTNAREVYLIALGKALATPKKTGPKSKKRNEESENESTVDSALEFSRPAAPNRTATTSTGRPGQPRTQPTRAFHGIDGFSMDNV